MRVPLLLLFLGLFVTSKAQLGEWPTPQANASLEQLPPWMYELLKGEKPGAKWKPAGQQLHTNQFLGEWSVQFRNGRRVECWSDDQRLVFREYRDTLLQRATLLDLHANVRMNAEWYKGRAMVKVEDIRIPQAGYFRELWNDSVASTGRTQEILGHTCTELRGIDGNKDSTYYWHSDAYPELFVDLGVWAQWLCREGDLEYLSALSDRNAGGSLRVDWNARKYGPAAGSIWFTAIRPGRTPMPVIDLRDAVVQEARFMYINSSQLGRLPEWMRARINPLPPDPLPVAYTPPAVDRHFPDNAFVGTFTAETPTRYIDEHQDTTLQIAQYSYWADARRAVLTLNDPDDEGIHTYMVDLDADVVVYGVNEGHSYVIPKLYIATLEHAGLVEFGRGLELEFTPTGKRTKHLGRKCEVYTANASPYLSHFLFSDLAGPNPIFDMARWMQPRPSQKFKDILVFGVADMPVPFAVMGTHFTRFSPGKAAPPAMDLSNYSIRDERLRQARDRERERTGPTQEVIEYNPRSMEEMDLDDVPVMMEEEVVPEPPPVAPR